VSVCRTPDPATHPKERLQVRINYRKKATYLESTRLLFTPHIILMLSAYSSTATTRHFCRTAVGSEILPFPADELSFELRSSFEGL